MWGKYICILHPQSASFQPWDKIICFLLTWVSSSSYLFIFMYLPYLKPILLVKTQGTLYCLSLSYPFHVVYTAYPNPILIILKISSITYFWTCQQWWHLEMIRCGFNGTVLNQWHWVDVMREVQLQWYSHIQQMTQGSTKTALAWFAAWWHESHLSTPWPSQQSNGMATPTYCRITDSNTKEDKWWGRKGQPDSRWHDLFIWLWLCERGI